MSPPFAFSYFTGYAGADPVNPSKTINWRANRSSDNSLLDNTFSFLNRSSTAAFVFRSFGFLDRVTIRTIETNSETVGASNPNAPIYSPNGTQSATSQIDKDDSRFETSASPTNPTGSNLISINLLQHYTFLATDGVMRARTMCSFPIMSERADRSIATSVSRARVARLPQRSQPTSA